jgi:CheY-like chemotaxis protein
MKTISILLVEDDQVDVMDIRRSLDKLNILYQITVAKNGEEALALLGDNEQSGLKKLPDVVLIDINMPKMNGFELLEAIRRDDRWKHLKCFIVTTSGEKVDRDKAKALGVSGYIIKPIKLTNATSMDTFNLMIDLMNFKSSDG